MSGDSISHGALRVSPLSSHEGLSSAEITKDCLEKAQALLCVLLNDTSGQAGLRFHHQLSLLDDLVDLALKSFG